MFWLWLYSYIAAITPGHSHSPQSGEAPANLSINKQWVIPGQMLELELTTKDNSTFKGFIIQARDLRLKDQQVIMTMMILCLLSTSPNMFGMVCVGELSILFSQVQCTIQTQF